MLSGALDTRDITTGIVSKQYNIQCVIPKGKDIQVWFLLRGFRKALKEVMLELNSK